MKTFHVHPHTSGIAILLLHLFCIIQVNHLSAQPQDHHDAVATSVTKPSIEAHLRFLAHDLLKGRDTPSEGLDIAAAYAEAHFHKNGVKPFLPEGFLQEVKLKNTMPADEGNMDLDGAVLHSPDQFVQLRGGDVRLQGKIIYLDYGTDEDFQNAKVAGKVVLTRSGKKGSSSVRDAFVENRAKARRAEEAGALALVELYNTPQLSWSMLLYYVNTPRMSLDEEQGESAFPSFWVEDVSGAFLEQAHKLKGSCSVETVGSELQRFSSQNVIGWVEGTDAQLKDEFVVYSAHYDHVGIGVPDELGDSIYNGTRDNAIGTTTVLEAAEFIAANPMKRSALFVLFTGEEKGLLGSEWFVKHAPLPMEQVVFCFNSDNAGYNDTSIATIVGLSRTTAGTTISQACNDFGIEAIDDPEPRQNFFDRSDQKNFAEAGVPALMFSLGMRSMDEEMRKYYHRPADNPDSVDFDYLHRFTKAYVKAAVMIGNAAEKPFWIPGDKYFDAGQKLYGL